LIRGSAGIKALHFGPLGYQVGRPALAGLLQCVHRQEEVAMPLVTLTVRKPKSSAFKTTILNAVHAALVSSGVPAADKFQRVIELEAEDFRFDPSYPDVKTERNEDFALVEVLWSVGRSVKIKKKLLEELMGSLARAGIDTENVMVCFKETSWENWAFAGGRLIHT
jgi:phenylpyruvate tautomerase PptA (4-oxalocrotonate tautomerase family)